ncbi:hypothetical protein HZA97_02315 [Candidatus Woesearchaeota archaeon]|nr:hypothetical protein [Candidatus Woesearchaeota archaeon]
MLEKIMKNKKIAEATQELLQKRIEQTAAESKTFSAECNHAMLVLPELEKEYKELSYFRNFRDKNELRKKIREKRELLQDMDIQAIEFLGKYADLMNQKFSVDIYIIERMGERGEKNEV